MRLNFKMHVFDKLTSIITNNLGMKHIIVLVVVV